MSRYAPHKWLLVQVISPTPHFRVFGSWSGSYLEGDSWRMNSGVAGVVERPDRFEIVGGSGSVYEVGKKSYGATAYGQAIVNRMCQQHIDVFGGDTAKILDEAEAIKVLEDWASE